MLIEIKILKVFCGDSIFFKFLGEDGKYHNIIIDGGYVKTYAKVFKPEITRIINLNEKIEGLILSHYDSDHIGGILAFVKDNSIEKNIIKEWWINAIIPISISTTISTGQLITLRDYLISESCNVREGIFFSPKQIDIYGAKITILSPDEETYKLTKKIIEEEIISTQLSKKGSDYKIKIEDSNITENIEDDSISNKSSIALMLEIHGYTFLFLADSIPSIIVNSLNELGYSKENKLKVDYIKLSHHGSRGNISLELLEYIDCTNFILSSNGINKHNLPNKGTFAMILRNPERDKTEAINFYFNQCDNMINSIFKIDDIKVNQEYNFQYFYTDTIQLNSKKYV